MCELLLNIHHPIPHIQRNNASHSMNMLRMFIWARTVTSLSWITQMTL